MNQVAFAQSDLDDELSDTIAIPTKSTITIPPFNRINPDTLKIGINDEIVSDSYCALGMPAVYDALHSFHSRRMDKFGGYINSKINKGLENIRKKGFKSDIKHLYIQIDPKTLTVYWIAVVGPSTDGKCYVRFDSRGSAGGGVRAVENQLPMMHSYYPTLNEVKVLEFNENVIKCYDWNGNPVSSYSSYVNIRQHFFKYYDKQVDVTISLEEYTKKYPCNTDGANLPGKKKPVVKSRQRKYKVKSGDTLSEIAQKYHTSVSKIKKANGLRSDLIRTGQVLKIP
jgi:LysM repeat protein